MAIYSGFSHEKWWCSIAMWNYQRVEGIFAVSCSWRPKLFYLVKLAIIDGLLGQLFPVLCSAHRRTAHTFPLKSPRIKLRLHPLAPQLATCLVLSHVPWRIHGAGRKMLTWLGFIDGIHVTIAAPLGSSGCWLVKPPHGSTATAGHSARHQPITAEASALSCRVRIQGPDPRPEKKGLQAAPVPP